MTYQQVQDIMSRKDKMAMKVISHLKINDKNEFVPCLRNDILLEVANKILGRDPLDRAIFLLGLTDEWFGMEEEMNLAVLPLRRQAN